MTTTTGSGKSGLNVIAFGIAIGVVEAFFMMVFAWAARLFDYGIPTIMQIADLFHGYGPGFAGGIIGGLWGLLYGFVFGVVAASVYNCTLKYKLPTLPLFSTRKIRRKKR